MRHFFLFFSISVCLNLSHAQTVPPITVPSLPSVPSSIKDIPSTPSTSAPTGPAPAPATPTPPADPLAPLLNSAAPVAPAGIEKSPEAGITTPKYIEYQAVCRTHEYDQVQYLSDALKEKRIQLLQDKIKQEPESVKLKTRLLKEFVDQKKMKDAEGILKQLRSMTLSFEESKYAEALYSFGKSEKKAARDGLNKLLAEKPKNVEALKLLADIYKSDANYFEYEAIYLDLTPITKENYDEQLCEVLTLDSRYADAEKYCQRGAAENKSPLFSIYLGVAAREKENFKEAQKQFQNSLKIKETEMGLVCSGEIFLMQKNLPAAQELFLKATVANPKSMRAHASLAWSYFNDKKRTEALQSFQAACALNKAAAADVRKAVKVLIDEKSDFVKSYSAQIERCMAL